MPTLGDRILKVNHAGEHGAVHIYAGQIAIARVLAPGLVAELEEFRAHEQRHRSIFAAELQRRRCPRCRSYTLCALGGFVLGALTALLGARAIAATTVAVERVVLRHLDEQLHVLKGQDPEAVTAIQTILSDEQQHHDQAASRLQNPGPALRLLQSLVALSTEAVIWLGMRL